MGSRPLIVGFCLCLLFPQDSLTILAVQKNSESSESLSYLHFLLGSLKSLENDPRGALEHFQFSSHFNPKDAEILLKQAEEMVVLGQNEQAKKILEGISKIQKDNADYHVLVAKLASQDLDVEKASDEFQKAVHLYYKDNNFTKYRETVLTKVAMLTDFRRYDESIESLCEYLKESPEDEVALYFLGRVHSIFQNRNEAKIAYQKALEIRPGFSAAAKALGLLMELDGDLTGALKVYQTAVSSYTTDDDLLQKLINLSLVLEDYEKALSYLNQYLVLKPQDSQSRLKLGLIYYRLKRANQAKQVFEALLQENLVSHDRLNYYLGTINFDLKDFTASVKYFRNILVSSEYYVESRLQIASILASELNKRDEAIIALETGVKERPDNVELPLALATYMHDDHRLADAIRVLQAADLTFKNNEQILYMLGTFLDKSGAVDEGIKKMRDVLVINPNHAHALNHIGYSFAERKMNLKEAEDLLKRAVQNAPENGFIIDSLGWVYFQMGKFDKAKSYLERASALAQNEPVILEHLADTYSQLGMHQRALAVYKQIMQISGKNEPLQTASTEDAPTDANPESNKIRQRVRGKLASLDSTTQH